MKEIKLTKSGEYMCSACKAAPRIGQYPRKWKWKTEKGFLGHSCYDDAQKNIIAKNEEYKKRQEEALEYWKKNAKYKIGDTFYYYYFYVSKPTHEYRGNRLVRVRYEEKRQYCIGHGSITGIYFVNLYSFGYNHVPESKMFLSETDAKNALFVERKKYIDACNFASMVR